MSTSNDIRDPIEEAQIRIDSLGTDRAKVMLEMEEIEKDFKSQVKELGILRDLDITRFFDIYIKLSLDYKQKMEYTIEVYNNTLKKILDIVKKHYKHEYEVEDTVNGLRTQFAKEFKEYERRRDEEYNELVNKVTLNSEYTNKLESNHNKFEQRKALFEKEVRMVVLKMLMDKKKPWLVPDKICEEVKAVKPWQRGIVKNIVLEAREDRFKMNMSIFDIKENEKVVLPSDEELEDFEPGQEEEKEISKIPSRPSSIQQTTIPKKQPPKKQPPKQEEEEEEGEEFYEDADEELDDESDEEEEEQ